LLEAARRDAAGPSRGRKDSENLKDKEREIREKLVLKLKKKAEGDVEHQQGKISKSKTDGFESVSDEDLSGSLEDVSNEEDMEEISDDEMESDDQSESEEDKVSEIDSEEELRLTSTDDSEKESKRKKKKKKDKKEKRAKKEKKKKGGEREKERDRETRKERELRRQIHLAERIASRRSPVRREAKPDLWEHEKYDRERERGRRERTPTGYYGAKDYYERRRRSVEREEREAAPMDEFERDEYERKKFMNSTKLRKVNRFLTQSGMRKEQVEKEMERAYEKYFSSLARKEGGRGTFSGPRSEEQAKEEQWERMTNPHLFGGSGGGGFRKVKVGQHYEEVQKEVLQHEIRIRERREKMDLDRDRGDYRQRDRGASRREGRRERW